MKTSSFDTVIDLEYKLRRISGMIKQKGRLILTNYPITSSQFVALQWIIEEKNITIGQLAKRIGLAFSSTTDLVAKMEDHGLIVRKKDPNDGRVVRIYPLDKGKLIIQEVIEKRQKYLNKVLENFSEEEKNQLNKLLGLLCEQMEKTDL